MFFTNTPSDSPSHLFDYSAVSNLSTVYSNFQSKGFIFDHKDHCHPEFFSSHIQIQRGFIDDSDENPTDDVENEHEIIIFSNEQSVKSSRATRDMNDGMKN